MSNTEKHGEKLTKPKDLDDEASKFWRLLVPELLTLGILRKTDAPLMYGLVRWWSIWREMDAIVRENPSDWKAICAATAAWKQVTAILPQLGLTPAAREKLVSTLEDDQGLAFDL